MSGIHHITAITSDPQKNIDFYEGFLGQRLVKRTVNFDDPRSYHFYFGDAYGKPGTLLTFFYWPHIPKGQRGVGEVQSIQYGINATAKRFWVERASAQGVQNTQGVNAFGEEVIQLIDPDGITIELVVTSGPETVDEWAGNGIPSGFNLKGFYGATLAVDTVDALTDALADLGYSKDRIEGEHTRFRVSAERAQVLDVYEAPDLMPAVQGSGSVHHIAFRAANDVHEIELQHALYVRGLHPTQVIDRNYFHSVYFMTPSRILFEIATDNPGFAIDEDRELLGEKLVLPQHFESQRREIEEMLVPITLPRFKI